MFEVLRIKLFGNQPIPKITDKELSQLILRDFGANSDEVKQKLRKVKSDTPSGKNRISAAIIKLSNKDFFAIDQFIEISNNDFRDVISQTEYPKSSELGFTNFETQNMKQIYLEDWEQYV